MGLSSQRRFTAGSPCIPNCATNPGRTRKKALSVKYPALTSSWKRSTARGDHARMTSTTKLPRVVSKATRKELGAAVAAADGAREVESASCCEESFEQAIAIAEMDRAPRPR